MRKFEYDSLIHLHPKQHTFGYWREGSYRWQGNEVFPLYSHVQDSCKVVCKHQQRSAGMIRDQFVSISYDGKPVERVEQEPARRYWWGMSKFEAPCSNRRMIDCASISTHSPFVLAQSALYQQLPWRMWSKGMMRDRISFCPEYTCEFDSEKSEGVYQLRSGPRGYISGHGLCFCMKAAKNVDVKINAFHLGSSSGSANMPQDVVIYAKLGFDVTAFGKEDGWRRVFSANSCCLPLAKMAHQTPTSRAAPEAERKEDRGNRMLYNDRDEAISASDEPRLARLQFDHEVLMPRGQVVRFLILSSLPHGIALRSWKAMREGQTTDTDETICLFAGKISNGHDPFTSSKRILGFQVDSSGSDETGMRDIMSSERGTCTRSSVSAMGGEVVGFAGEVEYEVIKR
mmetsp:Transcript_10958/g.24861  ORF Transcript_10958/g.24861 Transcript_10958/m.24861 type:complete len:400 (-) Transcript_10958:2-1201(-)